MSDLYQEITNNIVAALENVSAGKWTKPWGGTTPANGSTNKEYNGINVLILWIASINGGFASQEWLTYKQAAALGGQVRKGEKGTKICFFKPFEIHVDANGNKVEKKDAAHTKKIPLLRGYTVFNRNQIEGLPEAPETAPVGVREDIETFLGRQGANVTYGAPMACYIPATDEIKMPARENFHTTEGLYATAFHEYAHWTGAKERLERDLTGRFGSESYAMEELVAELASAFLCGDFKVEGNLQHPEYIKAWVKRMKDDKYAIFAAAREAKAAVNFMKGMVEVVDAIEEEWLTTSTH